LPQNLIYREVEEHSGITLEQYINSKFTEIDFKANDTTDQSQKTVISEVKAIDLILKVISLTDLLHSNQIIHTNLCPEEIFLRGENVDQMCFTNLYHAHWNTK
jgi:tRNA A-37 threonylcarbamoyl transferase component Bud32